MASTLQAFRAARLTPKITVAQRCNVKASAYKVTFVSDKGVSKDVMCDEDDYLLDAADAGGVDLPAACRGGMCGTCVAKLLSGKVDLGWLCDLDDGSVLTQEQMDAGFILPCSAKPLSDLEVQYSYDWGVAHLEQWSHTART